MGAAGYPIFVAARTGTLSGLAPLIRSYREAYAAAGYEGRGEVFLRVPVYVAETEAAAHTEPEESIMRLYRYLGERLEESATREGVRAIEARAERGQQLRTVTWEEALRDKVVVGTPQSVTERLRGLQDELGLDGIVAELNSGSLVPHARIMKCLQLLCEEVIPRFH
jgi:alkanesulfonate monooxygenase SsuD/methylene tetrahydromethanopterin reductase-like flavin-dependent oxidoreductase (luciferase family)